MLERKLEGTSAKGDILTRNLNSFTMNMYGTRHIAIYILVAMALSAGCHRENRHRPGDPVTEQSEGPGAAAFSPPPGAGEQRGGLRGQ